MGDIKTIMTLRNGKQINQRSPPFLHEEDDDENSEIIGKRLATKQDKEEQLSNEVERKP